MATRKPKPAAALEDFNLVSPKRVREYTQGMLDTIDDPMVQAMLKEYGLSRERILDTIANFRKQYSNDEEQK